MFPKPVKVPTSEIVWEDLPKPINAFTVRNASMVNLNTGEVIQYYSANTKIVVLQKCVTDTGTFYRTLSAEHHNLNWAFEATALGLPNEIAPLAPKDKHSSSTKKKASTSSKPTGKKQTIKPTAGSPRAEEEPRRKGFLVRLFHKS